MLRASDGKSIKYARIEGYCKQRKTLKKPKRNILKIETTGTQMKKAFDELKYSPRYDQGKNK